MTFETLILETDCEIARLTFNRPNALNAFTARMFSEMASALDHVADSGARVVVITGAGRGFCSGQDLTERKRSPSGPAPDLSQSLEERVNPLIRKLTEMPMPVLCAVNGVAAGFGATLSLACDLTIARKSAKFIYSFGKIGLLPDGGATLTLPRAVGMPRALGIGMLAETISADIAERSGMIWSAVDDDDFDDEVRALADRLASAPTLGIIAMRKAMRSSVTRTLAEQLDIERDCQGALGRSADYEEGVAAFFEKRQPTFKGK